MSWNAFKIEDWINKEFGDLTIKDRYPDSVRVRFLCVCSCGRERVVRKLDLTSGITYACTKCQKKSSEKFDINSIIGVKFNRLEVIGEDSLMNKDGTIKERRVSCKCDCGNIKTINYIRLKTGQTISCGCYTKEVNHKHGLRNTSEYGIWCGIKKRCYDVKSKLYKYYGAKDVRVCDEWLDKKMGFENFIRDMGFRPSDKYSIERKDVTSGYNKDNCIWATDKEQGRNKRNTLRCEYEGEIKPLVEWAEIFDVNYQSLWGRFKIDKDLATSLYKLKLYGKSKNKVRYKEETKDL